MKHALARAHTNTHPAQQICLSSSSSSSKRSLLSWLQSLNNRLTLITLPQRGLFFFQSGLPQFQTLLPHREKHVSPGQLREQQSGLLVLFPSHRRRFFSFQFTCPKCCFLRRAAACRLKAALLILGHLMKRWLLRGNWISRVASPRRSRQLRISIKPRGRQRGADLFGGAFANCSPSMSSQTTDTKHVYFGLYFIASSNHGAVW